MQMMRVELMKYAQKTQVLQGKRAMILLLD
jgi:hypothetical protein